MRHKHMGVQPEHLPAMQQGVILGIDAVLDVKLTAAERASWNRVFDFVVACMQRGMAAADA